VALGFECPLFVPLATSHSDLTRARPGECLPGHGSRPWSAGAGPSALAVGLVQVTWVLRQIRDLVKGNVSAHIDWKSFQQEEGGLFLWEGFVSGSGKAKRSNDISATTSSDHQLDAKHAVEAFERAYPDPMQANAIRVDGQVHSLFGAALLRTGWATDIKLLEKQCLVIRAMPYQSDQPSSARDQHQ
jgi:hypothetical protein